MIEQQVFVEPAQQAPLALKMALHHGLPLKVAQQIDGAIELTFNEGHEPFAISYRVDAHGNVWVPDDDAGEWRREDDRPPIEARTSTHGRDTIAADADELAERIGP